MASVPAIHTERLTKRFGEVDALAPAVDPRWPDAGLLVAVGAVAAAVGVLAFDRRDVAPA